MHDVETRSQYILPLLNTVRLQVRGLNTAYTTHG